jgi:hypothetical protein
VFDEQEDLSIEQILEIQDSEYLEKQVFIILNEKEIDSNKQQFWGQWNASN